MGNETFTAAVIGSGMIANQGHIPAYLQFPDRVSLRAVCGRNEATTLETARRYGIEHFYTSPAELLEREKPDIVSICTPNQSHRELVELALNMGCHVICEKPVALHYADAKALYELAARKGKLLVACQSVRFQRPWFAAKEYIEEGHLGQIYFAQFDRVRRRGIPTWGSFHRQSESGGGAMADIGVHALDGLLWILGNPEVESVTGFASNAIAKTERDVIYDLRECGAFSGAPSSARFDPEQFDVEEFASGCIRTKNGIAIQFKAAWAANAPNENSMTILGSKGGLTLPQLKLYSTLGRNQTDMEPRLFPLGEFDDIPFGGHRYLIRHTLNVLSGSEDLLITPAQTLNICKTLDLFYRSAAMGREVFEFELTQEEIL